MGYKTDIATLQRRLDAALEELERARHNQLRPEAIRRLEMLAQTAEIKLIRALERNGR